MESASPQIVYPTVEQIIETNRRMIERSGGFFMPPNNFQNENSLMYIMTAISDPISESMMFSSLKDKAAALAHQIIAAHVFNDGCKRTGIHIAWEFLESNNVPVFLDESIIDLAVELASGFADRNDLLDWLHAHQ